MAAQFHSRGQESNSESHTSGHRLGEHAHIHGFGHHHHHLSQGLSEAADLGSAPSERGRLVISILLNLIITIAEVIGGILSGSLALLSDAIHNLSDTVSLGISYVARRISVREATPRKTFGYKRAEIIGAFVNLITLVIVALFLIMESVERFLNPQPIDGWMMLIIATIGLAANIVTAALLFRGSRSSLNLRSAFLHIYTDGLSSAAVVIGGLLIVYADLYIVDPILTVAISMYLIVHSYQMLRVTVDILMEGTPRGVDVATIVRDMQTHEKVIDMHHVHVWQLDESHVALEAHVVIADEHLQDMETIKSSIKERLKNEYHISHSTLEFEHLPCDSDAEPHCYDPAEQVGSASSKRVS